MSQAPLNFDRGHQASLANFKIETVDFLFTQGTPLKAKLCQYMKKISEIEKVSGLKFFEAIENSNIKEGNFTHEIGCTVQF